jgi:hypothetical protein
MNKSYLRRVIKVLALLYSVVCAVVFLLPIGGCATQSVLNSKIGRRIGEELLLPPENVTQSPDQNIIIHILYRDTSTTRMFLLETTIASSNMLSFIERSPRQTVDNTPIVDVVSCIAMGKNRWLDNLPLNAATRFASCPWGEYRPGSADAWYASNSFATVHSLRIENQPLIVAFRGRSKSYEEWACWSTPVQDILLVPATCWDVLTAIFQIPLYLAGDIVHSMLSLGDPGNNNPWRHLKKPSRFQSQRILDAQWRRILMTQETYDDIQYEDAKRQNDIIRNWVNVYSDLWDRHCICMQFKHGLEAYKRYLAQMPNGRHVPDAISQIAQIEKIITQMDKDYRKFDKMPDSHDSLQDLMRYIETHPSNQYTKSAKATVANMLSNVVVEVRRSTNDRTIFNRSTFNGRVFAVGITTRADVESFIGRGVSAASSNSPGTRGFAWQVWYQRGKRIPIYSTPYPLPRHLVLMFDGNDVLIEIQGD